MSSGGWLSSKSLTKTYALMHKNLCSTTFTSLRAQSISVLSLKWQRCEMHSRLEPHSNLNYFFTPSSSMPIHVLSASYYPAEAELPTRLLSSLKHMRMEGAMRPPKPRAEQILDSSQSTERASRAILFLMFSSCRVEKNF